MNKKYVSELSNDELRKVFEANKRLREDVADDFIETEMYWIGEHLDCLRAGLSDWSIGPGGRNYLRIKDAPAFIEGMQEAQRMYGVLPDKDAPIIEETSALIDEWRQTDVIEEEDRFIELEEEIDRRCERIGDMLISVWESALNAAYSDENLLVYFLDFYVECRLYSDCYVRTDDDDYVLYEDMTRSFAS